MRSKIYGNVIASFCNRQVISCMKLSDNNFKKKISCYKFAKENRHAVSEVITTVLLLAITVVGATMVYTIFQGTIAGNNIGSISLQKAPASIILIGYDTRIALASSTTPLEGIPNLYNVAGPQNTLCASSCSSTSLPSAGGTDFIVLQFRNQGASSINLYGITINEVVYGWDGTTAGVTLNPSGTLGSYPSGGKYSLVSSSSQLTQFKNPAISANSDVLIVVKLGSSSKVNDIPLSSVIRITTNIGDIKTNTAFIVPAGQAS